MERQSYLIHNILRLAPSVWMSVLVHFLKQADGFRAFFPDDAELAQGKEQLTQVPSVSIKHWEGMRGSIQVTGPLSRAAVDLFLRSQPPDEPPLWSYELLRGAYVLLRVEDFTKCILLATSTDVEVLHSVGLPVDAIKEVDLFPRLPDGINIEPLTEEETAELERQLFQDPEECAE